MKPAWSQLPQNVFNPIPASPHRCFYCDTPFCDTGKLVYLIENYGMKLPEGVDRENAYLEFWFPSMKIKLFVKEVLISEFDGETITSYFAGEIVRALNKRESKELQSIIIEVQTGVELQQKRECFEIHNMYFEYDKEFAKLKADAEEEWLQTLPEEEQKKIRALIR
jgi:hypothetical protein